MFYFETQDKDNFTCKGFLASKDLKQKCKTFYSKIEGKAPSTSIKCASITKTKNDQYEAKLKIISRSCSITVKSKKETAPEAVEDIYNQFLVKILSWNKNRNLVSQQTI